MPEHLTPRDASRWLRRSERRQALIALALGLAAVIAGPLVFEATDAGLLLLDTL